MKKFWAILLAMMLVLSMVTVAGATEVENPSTDAEGFTITVNPKDDVDHEYQVYQIFTADVETNAGVKVRRASSGAQMPRTILMRSGLATLFRTLFWML